jgi:class 3 adenylate cyclase
MSWNHIGFQSKILLMMLLVSIISILVVGYLGYRTGYDAMTTQVFDRLDGLRQQRSKSLEDYFADRRDFANGLASALVPEMKALTQAYDKLAGEALTAEQEQALEAFYRQHFIPELAANLGSTPAVEGYLPTANAARYLQYHYTIASDDWNTKLKLDDAGDGSDYSSAHQLLQSGIRDFLGDDEDLMLIDARTGDIIYTAYKGVDLGANLLEGPYAATALAQAFDTVRKSGDANLVVVTDYEQYRPSYGLPSAFVVTGIFDGAELIGVLASQISSGEITEILTGHGQWARDGLGRSGDIYLVGADALIRSDTRALAGDPVQYVEALKNSGHAAEQIAALERMSTTVLLLGVDSSAIDAALTGASGTEFGADYLNVPSLSSFGPLQIPGLDWAIIAEIAEDEALAATNRLTQLIAISTVGLVVLVTFAGLYLSNLLARPLTMLTASARRVAAGDLGGEVQISSNDEFGALAESFNEMTRSLRVKEELIEQQQAEVDTLLTNMMPETLVDRFKAGQELPAERFSNSTILFADVAGFTEEAAHMPPAGRSALLNELVQAFDDATLRCGVEKVKTIGSGYMATAGLQGASVDHARRMVNFALELQKIVERYNRKYELNLGLRVGIDSGPVEAGIVGRNKFIYDLWGETVNMAFRIQINGGRNSIVVSDNVYRRVAELFPFLEGPLLDDKHGHQVKLWVLAPSAHVSTTLVDAEVMDASAVDTGEKGGGAPSAPGAVAAEPDAGAAGKDGHQ